MLKSYNNLNKLTTLQYIRRYLRRSFCYGPIEKLFNLVYTNRFKYEKLCFKLLTSLLKYLINTLNLQS